MFSPSDEQKLISKRKVQGMDTSRDRSKCTARVIEYFSYLRDLLLEYNFRDDKIFNCDETPCPIVTIISESIWIKERDRDGANGNNPQPPAV